MTSKVSVAHVADPGYWQFTAVSIIILFVLYLASTNQLAAWISILRINPAPAPKVQGAGQIPSAVGNAVAGITGSPAAGHTAEGTLNGPNTPAAPGTAPSIRDGVKSWLDKNAPWASKFLP